MISIDTGDSVFHRPSRETWLVACVRGQSLSWCGWPEGRARLSDCLLVNKATPAERRELLEDLAARNSSDHRCLYAREILGL
jgi:hypothetical protein